MVTSATTTNTPHKNSLSIVIPCYNSAGSITELLAEISEVMVQGKFIWEVILVNDGSVDSSWDEILQLTQVYPEVTGIDLARNFGQHNALFAGIMAAKNDFIVTMDDDLQHPAAEIPKLLDKAQSGYDLVYGTPEEDQHNRFRNFASWSMKRILEKSLDVHLASDTSAFRLFRKELISCFKSYVGPFVDIDAILFWGTRRIGTVTVVHRQRKYGDSNYNFFSLVAHTINMIASYSQVPLRISVMFGLLLLLFACILTLYVLGNYLVYDNILEGFTFLAVSILFFSGAQLLAIGIVGEYVGRLHHRSMGQPVFLIRETVSSD